MTKKVPIAFTNIPWKNVELKRYFHEGTFRIEIEIHSIKKRIMINEYAKKFIIKKETYEKELRNTRALFKALEPVNKAGLNMLKLESRPTRDQNWSYYFFLDIEGHVEDSHVAKTIEQIRAYSLTLKVLGSYPVYVKEDL